MHAKDKDQDAGELAERVRSPPNTHRHMCLSRMLAALKHFLTRGVSLCNIKALMCRHQQASEKCVN